MTAFTHITQQAYCFHRDFREEDTRYSSKQDQSESAPELGL